MAKTRKRYDYFFREGVTTDDVLTRVKAQRPDLWDTRSRITKAIVLECCPELVERREVQVSRRGRR